MVRIAGWREQNSSLFIHNHRRPDVGAAPVLPTLPGPVFVVRLTRLRDDVEAPYELAGDRIPCANIAARLRRQSLAGTRATDDEVLIDGQRIRKRECIAAAFSDNVRRDVFVDV